MRTRASPEMLQTIEKASDVLALFDRNHTEWGVREVAEALGQPQVTLGEGI